MEEKYILFSMEDERLQKLSEALSNRSCKKIINLLSEKELTETDLARELGIPLNTLDYNIKKLVSTGLIETTNHFWSIRGKKMPVYKLSNKKILISPKKMLSKDILLTLFAGVIGAGGISLLTKQWTATRGGLLAQAPINTAKELLNVDEAVLSSNASYSLLSKILAFPPQIWFVIGFLFCLGIFFLIRYLRGAGRG
jgi:DNA-binding transcriptional ArsR family regulator